MTRKFLWQTLHALMAIPGEQRSLKSHKGNLTSISFNFSLRNMTLVIG